MRRDPLLPGQAAVLAALLLYVVLPPRLTIGPQWVVPVAEGVLFAGLVAAEPTRRHEPSARRRRIALVLTSLVTLTNLVALGLLVHFLVSGGKTPGADLLGGGVVIWLTNLLLFAVWYWEIDRGGPIHRHRDTGTPAELLFAPMTMADPPPGWRPGFGDYLYLSLTNQSAFSPTDTLPLTRRMKALMGLQSLASLVTIGVIVARAVNILG